MVYVISYVLRIKPVIIYDMLGFSKIYTTDYIFKLQYIRKDAFL